MNPHDFQKLIIGLENTLALANRKPTKAVFATEDLPERLVEKISKARMDQRHAHLNGSGALENSSPK